MTTKLNLVHRFDPVSKKHYLNNWITVLHCHHYSTLFTDLATTAKGFGGINKLLQAGETVFGKWLTNYYAQYGIGTASDRVSIAEQYWKASGMGLISINTFAQESGTATMEYSHLDDGWLKKFGKWYAPVNFFTQGFLAGAFSAVYEKPLQSYEVVEKRSLVLGDDLSQFEITLKQGGR